MYTLATIDFSNRRSGVVVSEPSGVVVSEPSPDEMDCQDQTLDAKQAATLSDAALEVAVFGAA
jgi:hypothetical protein